MYTKRLVLLVLIIGLVLCAGFAYMVYNALLSPNTNFEESQVTVYIPTGSTMENVLEIMEPYLENSDTFYQVARRKKYDQNIKAGKYVLIKGMNNNDLINTIRSQNSPVSVSFNNQETLASLAGRIGEQIEADSTALLKAFQDRTFMEDKGFSTETALTMYLPNSYEFYWNTSADRFRDRMYEEYSRFWTEARVGKAKALGLSKAEVISLAAIVQKETAKVDERPRIAGVYLNRIKRGMKLQADPTVIFAIKHSSGNYDTIIKRVLYRDLTLDSPYNTYKYAGVPPGPITMPDISSIEAVLNSEKHNYLYFVVNVERFGYHMFASTLAQHNRNKAQYVRWINQQNINR
ncbi:MAG: endolytic transglycosylase MltG [Flavobacteriaceae bacterium]|nr:endolytic transglycosylase MltG [Flavobacteriaceae bacterium]MDH3796169.1 endolytic transglycosylase MltG [Flavobacteriaceae bacterium]